MFLMLWLFFILLNGKVTLEIVLLGLGIALLVLWRKQTSRKALIFGIIFAATGLLGILEFAGILSGVPFLAYGIPAVLSCYFDLFSGFVQAYVFSLLTMVYISASLPEPKPEESETPID